LDALNTVTPFRVITELLTLSFQSFTTAVPETHGNERETVTGWPVPRVKLSLKRTTSTAAFTIDEERMSIDKTDKKRSFLIIGPLLGRFLNEQT
jgi:hypothetical protein